MRDRLKIKICGMRDPENILDVAGMEPDFMGFIEYSSSPRFVGDDFRLPAGLPSGIRKVGVFVNASYEMIIKRSRSRGYEYVQLHGDESAALCTRLKAAGLKVIKVFAIGEGFNFRITKPYVPEVDLFLFDTKGKLYGGNSKVFDWNILNAYDDDVPFLLSGGLSTRNILNANALQHRSLYGLDLNSGVELSPGLKDPEMIRSVFNTINK